MKKQNNPNDPRKKGLKKLCRGYRCDIAHADVGLNRIIITIRDKNLQPWKIMTTFPKKGSSAMMKTHMTPNLGVGRAPLTPNALVQSLICVALHLPVHLSGVSRPRLTEARRVAAPPVHGVSPGAGNASSTDQSRLFKPMSWRVQFLQMSIKAVGWLSCKFLMLLLPILYRLRMTRYLLVDYLTPHPSDPRRWLNLLLWL